jgi:diphthamide biosynthesis protein 7
VSFSDGSISIFHTNPPDYTINENLISKISFTGSLMEIWDVKFASADPPLLFFGDDFSTLRAFEFSADGEWTDGELPTKTREFNDKGKFHEAGVTAILPLFHEDGATTLLTGSYDEYIRIYRYNQYRGSVLAEQRLGGGVWRLKIVKTENRAKGRCYIILASSMHAGARVLRINCCSSSTSVADENWSIEVLAEFSEHESMNYASDIWSGGSICPGTESGAEDGGDTLFVSSSFYDKRLCAWKFNIP